MEHEQGAGADAARSDNKRLGRTWAERLSGPIRFRKYIAPNGGGRESIIYKFHLPEGQTELLPEVYAVLHEMKYLRPRPGRDSKATFSGLKFTRDSIHGPVWMLPNDQKGRTTSEIIDAKLADLAEILDLDAGKGRAR